MKCIPDPLEPLMEVSKIRGINTDELTRGLNPEEEAQ